MGHQLSALASASSRTCHIPSPSDKLSDEELQNLIMNAKDRIGKMPELDILGSPRVYRLSPHALVAKYIATDPSNEVYAMQLVQQNTTVPVPQVRRVLPDRIRGKGFWLVMDYIDGECLLAIWSELGWWRRLQVICALRSYIRQLQQIPLPSKNVPGPMDGTGRPLSCLGGHFRDGAGPFPTYAAMAAWHDEQNHRYQVDWNIESDGTYFWPYSKFDTSAPLVLCHFDLHLRNIMLDKKNRVWLIDWAYAGAYPFWFEYVPFGFWANAASPDRRTPRSFARFLDFIVGSCASWYFNNYITKLDSRPMGFRHFVIDNDHFIKQGIDPKLYQPVDVARPSQCRIMAQKCLDLFYDTLMGVRALFVVD
ncbi:kinase-like domain-containing protein [Lentinula raphanica]|uniref:Kinase-like domain-containing protein n=1 Tax=Lentinula raphanica TaxID=153919 RepID=A0AA38PDN3_9AGAR|nr:kinase-like domain-containing protein [Lentinula raphanica]